MIEEQYQQFEFESAELDTLENRIKELSRMLIEKTIRLKSPIQVGDIVTEWYGEEKQKLQVTEISLYGVDDWGSPFSRMSFAYWGVPVKKDGITPMLNRKPIWFSSFVFDGKKYNMPSYNRNQIVVATMVKKWYER